MNTVTRDYIDGFFKLKSLEEWGNPETGGILETDDTIAALNLVPAKFGHILFFSKNQKAHDLVEKDKNGAYVLSEQERTDFIKASHQAMQEIHDILQEDPERILQVYKKWIKDDKLMSKIPGCKEQLETTIRKWEEAIETKDLSIIRGNYFINIGPHSGRLMKETHAQYVPQLLAPGESVIETSDALYSVLHNKEITIGKTLTREEIMTTEKGILLENEQFRAVLETSPSSFGHIAITWKNEEIGSDIDDFATEDQDAFFLFFNQATAKLTTEINNNHERIKDFYEQDTQGERAKVVLNEIMTKRNNNTWDIEPAMAEKKINPFYNNGGSFFPTIKTPSVYHFVPRYPFDQSDKGTGNALYQAFNRN